MHPRVKWNVMKQRSPQPNSLPGIGRLIIRVVTFPEKLNVGNFPEFFRKNSGNFPYLESSIKTINKNINHTFVTNDVIYAASLLSCDCEAASADSECIK